MRYGGILAMAVIGAALKSGFAAVDIPADDARIRYLGRWDRADPKHPRCDWPGTGFTVRFTGTSITVKLSGGNNDFNAVVDGVWRAKLTVDGKTSEVAAQGLAAGTHTLEITKRTEGFNGITAFSGLQLEDGQSLAALPAAPARRIQFIGDSFTAGYGSEAVTTACSDKRPFDNNYVAYGPVSAREVDADYSVQAISGIGMVHNYGDASPLSANPYPPFYARTLFGADKPKWDFASWRPDVVCVALGTNDFSTAVKPSQDQYATAYKAFIKQLRAWHPDARIMLISYAVDAYQEKYVAAIAADLAAQGEKNLEHVKFPGVAAGDAGCDYHPNVAAHRKFADVLVPRLKAWFAGAGLRPAAPRAVPGSRQVRSGETWRIPWNGSGSDLASDARGRLSPL
jgi:lysophospholipase L1-like esterase